MKVRGLLRRCGDCACFTPPPDRKGADPVALAGAQLDHGICRRFPVWARKLPDDFCFEFMAKEGKAHAG